jgi:PilZ domain-containing protein
LYNREVRNAFGALGARGGTAKMSTLCRHSRKQSVMGQFNDSVPPDRPERMHRRFSANFPVVVKYHFEDSVSQIQTVTKNVSVGGLLLESASPIPQHRPLSFIMTLHGGPVIRPIQLLGEGEVVRVECNGPSAGFAIAVKCKRQMRFKLPSRTISFQGSEQRSL